MTSSKETINLSTSGAAAVRNFRAFVRDTKRQTRFIYGREVAKLAFELQAALAELKNGLDDPRQGVEVVSELFRSDEAFFNHCDDSYGDLGQVFTFDARELFVHYAAACEDKKWISGLVLELQMNSNFGARDCLIDAAAQYLPEAMIRDMIDCIWKLSRSADEDYDKRGWLYSIESLARQIHDPDTFKKATLAAVSEPGIGQLLDLAEVYFESGDAETALTWLNKIPLDVHFEADRRDSLLLRVHQKLGHEEEAAEAAWRIFRQSRHEETFERLLAVIGSKNRTRLLDEEAKLILQSPELSYTDANFLLWCGKDQDAETYLFSHAGEIEGGFYGSVLPLAEAMEREERYLAATILYRSLLESILARAISKYYGHGIRYLRKLDELAPLVRTWRKFTSHDKYFLQLVEKHKRKSSFWERYEAKRKKEEMRM